VIIIGLRYLIFERLGISSNTETLKLMQTVNNANCVSLTSLLTIIVYRFKINISEMQDEIIQNPVVFLLLSDEDDVSTASSLFLSSNFTFFNPRYIGKLVTKMAGTIANKV